MSVGWCPPLFYYDSCGVACCGNLWPRGAAGFAGHGRQVRVRESWGQWRQVFWYWSLCCPVLAGGHWEWATWASVVAVGTAAAGLVASAAFMSAAAVTAAAAMVPSYSAPSVVLAPGLLVPVLAVPVILTEGSGIVLASGTGVRVVPSSRVVDAAMPACEVGTVVADASMLVVYDTMPLVVAAVPVRATMIVVVVDGVALLSLVV